jgi:hypothetical protein
MMDIVIPIVFPDYRIGIEFPGYEVDVFPFIDFDNFRIPSKKDRLSNLGHAGILFIDGSNGTTKYYEYGRYDSANMGLVRRVPIKDVKNRNGKIDILSLKEPLKQISKVAGQHGRIKGVYIEVKSKFREMLRYAELRKAQNAIPKRKPYNILTNSCIHFVKELTRIAGINNPWMIDPRPNSYIGEFRDDFADLDYGKGVLKIEGIGTF